MGTTTRSGHLGEAEVWKSPLEGVPRPAAEGQGCANITCSWGASPPGRGTAGGKPEFFQQGAGWQLYPTAEPVVAQALGPRGWHRVGAQGMCRV